MKKILTIALLLMTILTLGGCSKKNVMKEKNLQNFTLTQSVNGETNYVIFKDGNDLKVLNKENEAKFYCDFGSKTFEYKSLTKVITADNVDTEEDESVTLDYIGSVESDIDFSDKFNALKAISFDDLTKDGNGSYKFKELKQNVLLMPFLDGDIYLDPVTRLEDAYENGLVTLDSASLKVSNGCITNIALELQYATKTTKVEITISNVNTTTVDGMLYEGTVEKAYDNYLNKNGALITLDFEGYGKVQLNLFNLTGTELQYVNYFIYLIKQGEFKKALIDSVNETSVFFGDTQSEKGLKKTLKSKTTKSTVSNVRGTLSVVLQSTKNTSQLVLNTGASTDNDSSNYIPVAGVINGFQVLDNLSTLQGTEELGQIKVKVSIKYNGYEYTKPILK